MIFNNFSLWVKQRKTGFYPGGGPPLRLMGVSSRDTLYVYMFSP